MTLFRNTSVNLIRATIVPLSGLALLLGVMWISDAPGVQANSGGFDVLLPPGQELRALAQDANPKLEAKNQAEAKLEDKPPLTEEQKKVQAAVNRGVAYLKSTQNAQGGWGSGQHAVGYAALPGLAMLEVGVPASDPAVQKAAYFVRAGSPNLNTTYDLALAILFLDKLGNKNDVPIIRVLSLRLVAGQTPAGGWSYHCPVLTTPEAQQLVTFLTRAQPKLDPLRPTVLHPHLHPLPKNLESLIDPLTRREKGKEPSVDPLAGIKPLFDPDANPLARDPKAELPNPLAKPEPPRIEDIFDFIPVPKTDPKSKDLLPKKDLLIPPLEINGSPTKEPPAQDPKTKAEPSKSPAPAKTDPVPAPQPDPGPPVPVDLSTWPSVPFFVHQYLRKGSPVPAKGKGKGKGADKGFAKKDHDDNSNTQFAMLGLWAARRHGIPMNLSLIRLDERYRVTQLANGTWEYKLHAKGNGTPSMTCVGLLGLGIAHGTFQETAAAQKKSPPPLFMFDPAIQKGLTALSSAIVPMKQESRVNFYFLWSLERVMVMYQLPTIANTRWYDYGANLLLPRQNANGSWAQGAYPGSSDTVDTSMALLFLGRANLSRDLSDSLRRYMVVLDPALIK